MSCVGLGRRCCHFVRRETSADQKIDEIQTMNQQQIDDMNARPRPQGQGTGQSGFLKPRFLLILSYRCPAMTCMVYGFSPDFMLLNYCRHWFCSISPACYPLHKLLDNEFTGRVGLWPRGIDAHLLV